MTEREQHSHAHELLHEHISSAQNMQDLTSILQSIPLDEVQSMIHEYIDQLNEKKVIHHLHHSLSIDDILPECIIQYILSFNDLHHGKPVNAKWKQYSDKNEQIYVKAKLDGMMHDKYNPNTNTTWIIHPYRKKLYEWEQELKWKGPINTFNINVAIQNANSRDRILFNNGQYTPSSFEGIYVTKNLHLIGIGENVVFKDECDANDDDDEYYEETFIHIKAASNKKGNKLQIENIKFDLQNMYDLHWQPFYNKTGHIVVDSLSKLMMRNCVMIAGSTGNGIITNNSSYLDIKHCEFINYDDCYMAVAMAKNAHCKVINCTFTDCGHSTKCLSHYYSAYNVYSEGMSHKKVKPVCIGNLFINNGVSEEYYELKVDDFVDMIKIWIEEDNGLTKKMARNKLISKFDIRKQVIKYDKRFKKALNIIRTESCKV